MRTATGLTLAAIGAILAFAVRTSPTFLDLQITGWVIMLTGVAGLCIPEHGNGRLRRRIVTWRPRSTAVAGSRPRPLGIGRVLHQPPAPSTPPTAGSAVGHVIPGTAEPVEETVEEYFQDLGPAGQDRSARSRDSSSQPIRHWSPAARPGLIRRVARMAKAIWGAIQPRITSAIRYAASPAHGIGFTNPGCRRSGQYAWHSP